MNMDEILKLCIQYQASDVHILVGVQPYLRLHGKLLPVPESDILTPDRVRQLVEEILDSDQKELLEIDKELDFSYSLDSGERFRVNVFHEKGTLAAALRAIPSKIWSIEELGLPPIMDRLTKLQQGLILVTGPTGHGKSTSLAAMVQRINETRSEHIVTIEDPIEFVYKKDKSIISQRELHSDTHSWAVALKSVLREDPDVVLIGEMRDYETIEAALTIAETGHLVFATLHTNSAAQTIDRIVDVFPERQQQQVRSQLSFTLEAVLSQRLIPSLDEKRTAVVEVMLGSPAVSSNIREGKTHLLGNTMQTSGEMGMKTLEMALAEAYINKRISVETGRKYAQNIDDFTRLISRRA